MYYVARKPGPVAKVDEPEREAALSSFYRQTLDWRPCDDFQCAKLTVPVDYRRPDGPRFTLPVIKAAATRPGPLGTLVAGAGGPGQSGVTAPGWRNARASPRRCTTSSGTGSA